MLWKAGLDARLSSLSKPCNMHTKLRMLDVTDGDYRTAMHDVTAIVNYLILSWVQMIACLITGASIPHLNITLCQCLSHGCSSFF